MKLKAFVFIVFSALLSLNVNASSGGDVFDAVATAQHHALDAHDVHIFGKGDGSFTIPLPIIIKTDNGFVTFMSSEFHHTDDGSVLVNKNDMNFVKVHEKIYLLNAGETSSQLDEEGHVSNGEKVLYDFSITKNVACIFLVAILMFLIFGSVAKQYKGGQVGAPKGLASWMEPLILYVRDDIAKSNIGNGYQRFMPFLLTIFFFIWIGNLLGLIPFISNPNMTGNISVTLALAAITLIVQMMFSKKAFWKHIFMPPGVPIALYPILVPIELAGVIIKPVALMIRLFANITAGHIIIVSLISIIFINKNAAWAGLSVPMALFISVLELLVAFLQAYIFTMLAALFIGTAVEEEVAH
jgi:F-type H+-transporting ATPase subunit a